MWNVDELAGLIGTALGGRSVSRWSRRVGLLQLLAHDATELRERLLQRPRGLCRQIGGVLPAKDCTRRRRGAWRLADPQTIPSYGRVFYGVLTYRSPLADTKIRSGRASATFTRGVPTLRGPGRPRGQRRKARPLLKVPPSSGRITYPNGGSPSLDRTLNGGAAADNREGGLRSRGEVCQPPPLDHPDRPGVSTTAPRTGFLRFPVSPF